MSNLYAGVELALAAVPDDLMIVHMEQVGTTRPIGLWIVTLKRMEEERNAAGAVRAQARYFLGKGTTLNVALDAAVAEVAAAPVAPVDFDAVP